MQHRSSSELNIKKIFPNLEPNSETKHLTPKDFDFTLTTLMSKEMLKVPQYEVFKQL